MFTYGFYNSLSGDRKYDATQFTSLFDGIIEDGIFANIGEQFAVIPGNGMQVIVKTGRAWFNHTWNLNDSWLTLNVEAADTTRQRIDSVVLEVNSDPVIRENSIKIIKGTPSSAPTPPKMVRNDTVNQYRLANITLGAGATTIFASNIANKVGQDEAPFVIAPLKSIDISDLMSQWEGRFSSIVKGINDDLDNWYSEKTSEFDEWFNSIKDSLGSDAAGNLQNQVNERVKLSDLATIKDIQNSVKGKWIDANLLKSQFRDVFFNGLQIGDIIYSYNDLEAESNGVFLACDQREVNRNDYPELLEVDNMKLRYQPYNSVRKSTNTVYLCGGNPSTGNNRYIILGDYIRDGYLYSAQTSTTGITIKRNDIETNVVTTIKTIIHTSFSTYQVFYVLVFKDNYLYVLPTGGSQWYYIDLDTDEFNMNTVSGTNIAIDTPELDYNYYAMMSNAIVNADGSIDIYSFYAVTSTVWFESIDKSYDVKFTQVRYANTLRSRSLIASDIVGQTGGKLASSSSYGPQCKVPLYTNCCINICNGDVYNYYNGVYAYYNVQLYNSNTRPIYYVYKKSANSSTFDQKNHSVAFSSASYNTKDQRFGSMCVVNEHYIAIISTGWKSTDYGGSYLAIALLDIDTLDLVAYRSNNQASPSADLPIADTVYGISALYNATVSKDHTKITYMTNKGHVVTVSLMDLSTLEDKDYSNYFIGFNGDNLSVTYANKLASTFVPIERDPDILFYLAGFPSGVSIYDKEKRNMNFELPQPVSSLIFDSNKFEVPAVPFNTVPSNMSQYMSSYIGTYSSNFIFCKRYKNYILCLKPYSSVVFIYDDNIRLLPYIPYAYIKAKNNTDETEDLSNDT